MLILYPYLTLHGVWVFDEPRLNLVQEPFVGDCNIWLSELSAHCKNPEKGFNLLFSPEPFPEAEKFEWIKEDFGGNWYKRSKDGLEGWLCPQLQRIMGCAPKTIYAQARSSE